MDSLFLCFSFDPSWQSTRFGVRRTMLGVSISCAPLISRTIVVPRSRTTTMMRNAGSTPEGRRTYLRRIRSVLAVFGIERSIYRFPGFFSDLPYEFDHVEIAKLCSFVSSPVRFARPRSGLVTWRFRTRAIDILGAVNFRSPDRTTRTR